MIVADYFDQLERFEESGFKLMDKRIPLSRSERNIIRKYYRYNRTYRSRDTICWIIYNDYKVI